MRSSFRLLFVVVLALLLSACGLRTWVDVTIDEDSSGTVTFQVASDQELRDGLATFSPDTDAVGQLTEGLAEQGWSIDQAPVDGEWEGVVATQEFSDLEELKGLLGEALQGGDSTVVLEETDSRYTFRAALAPPAGDSNEADLFAQASEVIDIDGRLSMTFPGEVVESDGTVSNDGRTASWTYDEDTIFGREFSAEAEKPASFGVVTAIVIALGLLLGLLASRMVTGRRRASPSPGS